MTYNVFGGTLNFAKSQSTTLLHRSKLVTLGILPVKLITPALLTNPLLLIFVAVDIEMMLEKMQLLVCYVSCGCSALQLCIKCYRRIILIVFCRSP